MASSTSGRGRPASNNDIAPGDGRLGLLGMATTFNMMLARKGHITSLPLSNLPLSKKH